MGAIFSLLGIILDVTVYPQLAKDFALIRVLIVILLSVALLPVFDLRKPSTMTLLSHYIALVPQCSVFWMIYQSQDATSSYYAGLSLILVGASIILRWRFLDNVINATICLIAFIILLCVLESPKDVFISHVFFVFSTGVFASAGSYFNNRLRFREFQLRQELEESRITLSEKNNKLEALDEAKMRFFANISHELRTPLTLILGPIEQLESIPALQNSPKAKITLDTLSENGLRLLRLINDLLDLARLDTDDLPSRVENIELTDFAKGISKSLAAMAQTKQISLKIDSNLPHHPTQPLDRDRLEKILLNLTINALKFSETGSRLAINLREDHSHFYIEVRDQGMGISPEELPYIFERFWQGDSSTKRKTRGTGIGLALVKNLTESMEGAITVKSTLGKGTTFTLAFPILELLSESESLEKTDEVTKDRFDEIHEKALLHTTIAGQQRLSLQRPQYEPDIIEGEKKPQILIVDDEVGMRSYISSQLSNYRLIEAADGNQGLASATQYLPDLIVLDYMMPGLDGLELTHLLRENSTTSRIPIILLTAHAGDAPRISALEAGVNDFLTKPFSSAELKTRVRNILNSGKYERDLAKSNGDLSEAMTQLQEQEEALIRSEKLSSLGQMSAGIVHEINNPLNYAKTSLHILKSFGKVIPEDDKEDFMETLDDLEDGVLRVIRIVTDLRAFTRGDETVKGEIALAQVIRNASRLLSADLAKVNFETQISDELTLLGNDNQLCQAFVNLIQNAIHATAEIESPSVTVSAFPTGGGDLIVTVKDNGHGIPDKILTKIFDPFFTTKDVGAGMGLGLALTMRIIEDHRGKLTVESSPSSGTEFTIYFSNSHNTLESPVKTQPEPI